MEYYIKVVEHVAKGIAITLGVVVVVRFVLLLIGY